VKTGQTDAAGLCLVSAIRRDGHRILIVVLASPDRADESWRLADAAFAAYSWPRFTLPPDPFASSDGATGRFADAPVLLPAWQTRHLEANFSHQGARVEFRLGDEVVAAGSVAPECPDGRCP
jgi:D-alanyl-D-alanine carboxypeptidase